MAGVPGATHRAPVVRFWRRVDRSGECWLWTGSKRQRGYGQFSVTPKRIVLAHRYSFELANGPIPVGLAVCHRCDNPPCVNPAHLFLGDRAANARDRDGKGRGCLPPVRSGMDNASAKLTHELAAAIRADMRGQRPTAAAYGVSKSTVARIRQGRSWVVEETPDGI